EPAFACKPILGFAAVEPAPEPEPPKPVAETAPAPRPAVIGDNGPPDAIADLNREYDSTRVEAEAWLDGSPVENDGQMGVVDTLRASARQWRLLLERGQKSESAPIYDEYKRALDRWKPSIEDVKRIETGLVALVDGYKRKRAAEQEAE